MSTPPLLLFCALAFWGWQSGLWFLALPMALILEGGHITHTRWELRATDFNRITDLCAILLVTVLVLQMINDPMKAVISTLGWLPVVLFPLVAAQIYSTRQRVGVGALLLTLRKNPPLDEDGRPRAVDLLYFYLAACLLGAGTAVDTTPWYFAGVTGLSAWGLWGIRSRRFPVWVWILLLTVATFMGFGLQKGLLRLRQLAVTWYIQNLVHDPDPFANRTAIGDIGELKPSNRIVFRVKAGTGNLPPLLREAVYTLYSRGTWIVRRSAFSPLKAEADLTTWHLQPPPASGGALSSVTLAVNFPDGKGLLKLPRGPITIQDLPAMGIERNAYGTIRVTEGPGLSIHEIRFDLTAQHDSPPDADDLSIPESERQVIEQVVDELNLKPLSTPECIARLTAYFKTHFKYSLKLESPGFSSSAIAYFLSKSRKGHCEYFATATVLLLRAAGIPARYARGYAVVPGTDPGTWIPVRDRHAHAWALAWMRGQWRSVDTTPPGWIELEEDAASIWQKVGDLFAGLKFFVDRWRWGELGLDPTAYLKWLLIPLIGFLIIRIFRQKMKKQKLPGPTVPLSGGKFPGDDSLFYKLEAQLTRMGYGRRLAETPAQWVARVQKVRPGLVDDPHLTRALNLHYRYRFDPAGMDPADLHELGRCIDAALAGLRKAGEPTPSIRT